MELETKSYKDNNSLFICTISYCLLALNTLQKIMHVIWHTHLLYKSTEKNLGRF